MSVTNGKNDSCDAADTENEFQRNQQTTGCDGGLVQLRNPFIHQLDEDFLYHLNLDTASHNLPALFGDVKFVCMGGSSKSVEQFSKLVAQKLKLGDYQVVCENYISERYSMYKVGPVLSVSHDAGDPSISILLHELNKLMSYARAKDPIFFQLGTCEGIGIEPGTIILSEKVVDAMLQPVYSLPILGRVVKRPSILGKKFIEKVKRFAEQNCPYSMVSGKTMCTSDFYEGQARLDGAFCEFSKKEQMEYLDHLKREGILNIGMESTAFASHTFHAGLNAAIVCVCVIDRLKDDQISASKQTLEEWQQRPMELVADFIEDGLKLSKT